VRPTPAGVALLNLARPLLVDLDDIAVQMRDWSGARVDRMRVFANISESPSSCPRKSRLPRALSAGGGAIEGAHQLRHRQAVVENEPTSHLVF